MRLAVDPLAQPCGQGDWRSNVSVAQAVCLNEFSRPAHEGAFMRTWKWARNASAAALTLADKFVDSALRDECLRIAKRHDGVWRAANKLVRIDNHGKEVRAVVAVRSDAGDSTCPTFLERQGHKRSREMQPTIRACTMLGYTIASASSPPIPRNRVREALSAFADSAWRKLHFVAGVDILIVPTLDHKVIVHVLAAFEPNQIHNITIPITFDFSPLINIERFYDETACAAYALGPAAWIEAQVARFSDGKRARDRLTYGCFYGKRAESIIIQAATLEKKQLSNEAASTLRDIESKIAQSIELTKRCLSAGDLEAAKAAYGFVGAYIYDAHIDLALYPILAESLKYTSYVDFSGCTDAPALPSLHDSFMIEVRSLPHPKPLVSPQWRCIELVSVHSISDILTLIDWARNETPASNAQPH